MLLERYEFKIADDYATYFFESVGLKGVIKKGVRFSRIGLWRGFKVYNIGFGDWYDQTGSIDDSIISNNGDRDKVLATVAATVLEFAEVNGKVIVQAKGVTPARTRLYQMGINANLAEIQKSFLVFGEYEGVMHHFEAGMNYERFFVVKK